MTEWERGLDPSPEWQTLMDLMDQAEANPVDSKFVEVGQAAVAWARARKGSPRGATWHSIADALIDKESPVHTEALDHLGRTLVLGEAGATTVQATPDEGLAVDGLDQQ